MPIAKEMSAQTRRAVRAWIVQSALGWLAYCAGLFLLAGSLRWLWGWVLLGVLALFLAAHPLILLPLDPELLAERQQGMRAPGVKRWDRWITAFGAGLLPLSAWVIAALDWRLGWTVEWPLALHLGGLLLMLLGYGLFLWAMAANAFFAEGVRIQEERGHKVASSGPYRWVRHPGYAGAILSLLATPLLLGSIWALPPALLASGLYVLRTSLEDRLLHDELDGYREYASRTRYRLLPGIY